MSIEVTKVQRILDEHRIGDVGLAEEIVAALFPNSRVAYHLFLRDRNEAGDFNVILEDYNRDRMIATIKAVREVAPMGLKEAKDVVDRVKMGIPQLVLVGVSELYADKAQERLSQAGCETRNYNTKEGDDG